MTAARTGRHGRGVGSVIDRHRIGTKVLLACDKTLVPPAYRARSRAAAAGEGAKSWELAAVSFTGAGLFGDGESATNAQPTTSVIPPPPERRFSTLCFCE